MRIKDARPGTPVRFLVDGAWRDGTIRRASCLGIRVDDGDPADEDLHTNGFHVSVWTHPRNVRVRSTEKNGD